MWPAAAARAVTCPLASMRQFVALALLLLGELLTTCGGDLVIGTVVDVQVEEQDFESGWRQWREENMDLLDLTNTSDSRVGKQRKQCKSKSLKGQFS